MRERCICHKNNIAGDTYYVCHKTQDFRKTITHNIDSRFVSKNTAVIITLLSHYLTFLQSQQKESSPESLIFASVFKLDEGEWTFGAIRGDTQMDRKAIRTLRIESAPEKIQFHFCTIASFFACRVSYSQSVANFLIRDYQMHRFTNRQRS